MSLLKSTTHISLDLQKPNYVTVYAVQDDRLSRYINAELHDGAASFALPNGAGIAIAYRKPDGTGGFYDTLEDGSSAFAIETDGTVTIGLAEQALTVPGAVPVEIRLYLPAAGGGSRLTTWFFVLQVGPSVLDDAEIVSSNYYNVLTDKITQAQQLWTQIRAGYGAPLTAESLADMEDTTRVYVYVGATGADLTAGHWYYFDGAAWQDGGIYNSQGFVTDKTLTAPDAAADAQATGALIDDLSSNFKDTFLETAWDKTIFNGSYIGVSNGKSASSSKYARTSLWYGYPLRNCFRLANSAYEFCAAFYGEGGSLSTGAGYIESSGYVTGKDIFVPQNAVLVGLSFRRVDQAPLVDDDISAIASALSCLSATDTSFLNAGKAADSKTVGATFNEAGFMPLSSFVWERGRIAATGATAASSYDIRTTFIPVDDVHRSVRVILDFPARTGVTGNSLSIAEYSTNESNGWITTTQIWTSTEEKVVTFNSNTRYIRLYSRAFPFDTYTLALDDYRYITVLWDAGAISRALKPTEDAVKALQTDIKWLHTQPPSQGAYNAIRRAKQLANIKWTPVEDNKIRRETLIPAGSYEDTRTYGLRDVTRFYKAGTEYTGVPYSGRQEMGTTVGLETFATAASTPKSIFTENSYNIIDYGSPYYGSVCSNLVAYALSMPYLTTGAMVWYSGSTKKTMPGLEFVHDIVSSGVRQSLDDLELADILWVAGHTAMITDLIKKDGHVTDVEVTEASMTMESMVRSWMWTLEDFYSWFADFGIYRYTALDAIEYTPNSYAPMPDEGNTKKFIDYRVMPYYGNKCIRDPGSSATIKLIVRNIEDLNNDNPAGTLAYTHVVIEKNGVAFGDPIAVDSESGTTPYYTSDITLDNDEAVYQAYLAAYDDGSIVRKTTPCEWCTMPTHSPTVTFSNLTLTIVVNVKNTSFKPTYYIASATTIDNRYAIHITPDMITSEDNVDGSVTYTITKTYDADRTVAKLVIGYTSPEYGTKRELYTFS